MSTAARPVTDGTRALVVLSAAIAVRDPARLVAAVDAAAATADAAEVEEALLQSYLFVGYPAALHAIALWRERTGQPAPAAKPEPEEGREPRGIRVCRKVYGTAYDRLVENMARLQPELGAWMIEEGYGKVLGRPGLDLRTRELCIIGLLAAQTAPAQLYSHLRGALLAGAVASDVDEALDAAAGVIPMERAAAAYAVWQRVRSKQAER
jgi:4-carboxymuconolactone decarboxylase